MTNTEIIATIREEIGRRREFPITDIKKLHLSRGEAYGLRDGCLLELLSFLSDIEKSLPAKVADDGLNEEIERYFEGWSDDSEYGQAVMRNGACTGVDKCKDIARHFYELGCHRAAEKFDELEYNRQRAEESGCSEIPKDLEEAAEEQAKSFGYMSQDREFKENVESFIAGVKWQKEQIMKNTKDGWMDEECVIVLNDGTRVDLQPDYKKKPAFEFEYAQDVRVIVLPKEDGK